MGIYLEALILYTVLFLSGSIRIFAGTAAEGGGFSIMAELAKTLLYAAPALALIWYLLLKVKKAKNWDIKPCLRDLISGVITLPCLLVTGFAIAFISSHIGGPSAQVSLHFPSTTAEWAVLCFSLFIAAYLEESFFRFYLLGRREEFALGRTAALVLSVVLFSICHIYEGPWGFLNAVLSAVILGFIFLRYKSLHGIAIAHGMYNLAVYLINASLAQG